MAQARTVNVSRLVDGQKLGALHVWLIVWSFLVLLSDGYDIGAIAYAAPALAKLWHVTNMAAFGPVFSSLLVGMLIGAPLLGYLGDRFGRKKAIITGAIWYGLCVLAQTQAGSLDQLLWLRLLSGIGIGGILPNTIALNAEFAPARFRATMIIIMFTGITFGGGVPGPIAAWLVPHYGWQVLFFIGGIVPIVVGICLIWALPESLKFLAVRKTNHDEAVRVARMLAPQENFGPDTAFVTDAAEERGSTSPLELFKHGLGIVTPLLWILFMINLMVFYFMNSWIPLVFSDAGLDPNATALAVTIFQWGGTLGGYAIARPVDKWAFGPIIVFFAIGAIAVAAVGYLEHNEVALLIAVGVSGFCTLGLQFAINAMSGLIYPTQFRSMGVGWAFGAGRIGSFLGPMIGATLIATHLPFRQLFVYAAAPLLVGLVVSLLIVPAYNRARSGESLEPSLQGT
ncbi:MAG TPA: MFS transporter [Candidatus Acidoferrales bacterium]|nr:MFS transporter [Candidatus Acidoferrales bacterium]